MGPTWAAWLLLLLLLAGGVAAAAAGVGRVWFGRLKLAAAVGFRLAAVRVLYSAAWLRLAADDGLGLCGS